MKHKLFILLFIIMLTALLTGCWDRKDIENRGYVLGIAIDVYTPDSQEKQSSQDDSSESRTKKRLEGMEIHTGEHQYILTVQLPILAKSSTTAQGGSGGGDGDGKKTVEITQVGNSFMSMQREMQSRTSLSLYYEHLQVIVISEDAARQGLEDIIDFFVRDPEMRRRVKIFVSKGEAKSVLSVVPKVEEFASIYLASIPINARVNSRIAHETDLGEVIKSLHADLDFVLPMTQVNSDEIKVSGGAAFKDGKMVGWLSELETEAMKLIRNLYLGGVITVSSPENKQGIITMEVTGAKTNISPVLTGDEVAFNIDIKIKGNYAENVNMHTHARLDESFMKKLEKAYEKEVHSMCQQTINKMQLEYGADVFQFKKILKSKEPAYWKNISHQWDLIYPHAEVNINVDVSLQLIGIVQ